MRAVPLYKIGAAVQDATAGRLFLDGVDMGDLPAKAEAKIDSLEAGKRILELRFASGGSVRKEVVVAEGRVESLYLARAPGILSPRRTRPGEGRRILDGLKRGLRESPRSLEEGLSPSDRGRVGVRGRG